MNTYWRGWLGSLLVLQSLLLLVGDGSPARIAGAVVLLLGVVLWLKQVIIEASRGQHDGYLAKVRTRDHKKLERVRAKAFQMERDLL